MFNVVCLQPITLFLWQLSTRFSVFFSRWFLFVLTLSVFSFIVELLEGGRSDESGESSPGMDDEMRNENSVRDRCLNFEIHSGE